MRATKKCQQLKIAHLILNFENYRFSVKIICFHEVKFQYLPRVSSSDETQTANKTAKKTVNSFMMIRKYCFSFYELQIVLNYFVEIHFLNWFEISNPQPFYIQIKKIGTQTLFTNFFYYKPVFVFYFTVQSQLLWHWMVDLNVFRN